MPDNRPRPTARNLLPAAIVLVGLVTTTRAQFQDPFSVSAALAKDDAGHVLSLSFTVPANHYLYSDEITLKTPDGVGAEPLRLPAATRKKDPQTGEETSFYSADVTLSYRLTGAVQLPLEITVGYRGCDDKLCFLPQRRALSLKGGTPETGDPNPASAAGPEQRRGVPRRHAPPAADGWREIADRFTVARQAAGYLKPDAFIAFLNGASVANGEVSDGISKSFKDRGVAITVLLILLGGLLLNLTPCVLPMIPINLAIIGAGAQASSRRRGFALGSTYGAGMAAVYGILGLAVVLTGARFGALNSSPWFNFAIAALFLALSLAMFGVFNLDFSRFQGAAPGQEKRGGFLPAFLMGGVAALLAGACVAPVVIGVLLLSADLYQRGNIAALLLPFLLGIGMAIPWPFAGAGLSFLPKPGKWMEYIKRGFGIIILGAALYYGKVGYDRLVGPGQDESFGELLAAAERTGKPVLIDFWATWCKNCSKMEKTTFHDPDVGKQLEGFTLVKYQAEDLNDPEVKAILTHYGVLGLPTYIVLERK